MDVRFSRKREHVEYVYTAEQREQLFRDLSNIFQLSSPEERVAAEAVDADIVEANHADTMALFYSKVDHNGRLVLTQAELVDAASWKVLGEFLASNSSVLSLRLHNVSISGKNASDLGNGVLRYVRHISFCDNNLAVHERSLECLVQILLCCEVLKSAAFQRNSLTDSEVPHICTLLQEHPSLSNLSLCWNAIQDKGADLLSQALLRGHDLNQTALVDLDLSYNQLGDPGITSLSNTASFLRKQGRQLCLRLDNNRMPRMSWRSKHRLGAPSGLASILPMQLLHC
jgi:hypothetical protein